MADKKKVAVIGAGMVGIATASYLQRAGHDVVVIDPQPPGQGASFGNAGCFNPSSVVPVATPDTYKHVPKYLADPLGPLRIRWSYLPTLAPWLIRLIRAAKRARGWSACHATRPVMLVAPRRAVPATLAAPPTSRSSLPASDSGAAACSPGNDAAPRSRSSV